MNSREQRVLLYLTGGLGNQLFQYAALESVPYKSSKLVVSNHGHPRLNSEGEPEITSILGDTIKFEKLDSFSEGLVEKIIGLNLRLSVGKSSKFKTITKSVLRAVSNLVLTVLSREFVRIILDVEAKPNSLFRKSLLVGYFQVSNYAQVLSHVVSELPVIQNPDLSALISNAKKVSPLIVHLRRGDYASEKDFGMLDQNYYQNAFSAFIASKESSTCKAIWIFSDEIEYARKVLELDPDLEHEWFSEVGGSTSITLMAMSLGSSFIIANSTFSWWAAQLSSNSPTVYYPRKWFKNLDFNTALFPPDWRSIENGFEQR
jgi:hypothetical protein